MASPDRAAGEQGSGWRHARHTAWRVVTATVGASFRYRVTGLAGEAAFFAILSLPPLVFALAGSIGFFVERLEVSQVETFRDEVIALASRVLTDDGVDRVIRPTLQDVLEGGRFDVISVGFVLSLWSGSRALNVFVDTITIMYGLAGHRGIVRTRMLSFALYMIGLVIGVIVLPLVLAGPQIVAALLPDEVLWLSRLYWPTVIVLSVGFLAMLYHVSVPVRTSWRHGVPGAALALGIWVLGSFALRAVLETAVGSPSIFGPLAAPIAVLLWLYLTALAVLVGAALNAAFDRVWPESETARARLDVVRRLRRAARLERLRSLGGADAADEDADDDDPLADADDLDAAARLQKSGATPPASA
ncbi:MAG: YihY/virulence factor BrkB family protein [Actinomycetota bacterium]|nr:YihY/virulence factor BrkB family protein [Actinomycetota bacterium]